MKKKIITSITFLILLFFIFLKVYNYFDIRSYIIDYGKIGNKMSKIEVNFANIVVSYKKPSVKDSFNKIFNKGNKVKLEVKDNLVIVEKGNKNILIEFKEKGILPYLSEDEKFIMFSFKEDVIIYAIDENAIASANIKGLSKVKWGNEDEIKVMTEKGIDTYKLSDFTFTTFRNKNKNIV